MNYWPSNSSQRLQVRPVVISELQTHTGGNREHVRKARLKPLWTLCFDPGLHGPFLTQGQVEDPAWAQAGTRRVSQKLKRE